MGLPISSKTRIYAAEVSVDVVGTISYRTEHFVRLDNPNGPSPLPTVFVRRSPVKRRRRRPFPLSQTQVRSVVILYIAIVMNGLVLEREIPEGKTYELVNIELPDLVM